MNLDDELQAVLRQFSKEQMVYIIETILKFEPVNERKCRNLILYGTQATGTLRQAQTGDRGQVRADKQYKG